MEHLLTLEFDKILRTLSGCAVSDRVKERCLLLTPARSLKESERLINETTEAKRIVEHMGTPPLAVMSELRKTIADCAFDILLTPEQIGYVSIFLMSCRRMKDYLKRAESTGSETAFIGGSIIPLTEMEDEINRCIRGGCVDDRASQHLFNLRRSIGVIEEQIRSKLTAMLRKNKEIFSESFVAVRSGRFTLPVKKEYKNKIEGVTVELSNTGGTCFIEPMQARKLQDSLTEIQIEEDAEVRRILYELGALIYDNLPNIEINIEAMETLDFMFAKAKLSIDMKASQVRLVAGRQMRILTARHPHLNAETAVPLDFALGSGTMGVIITGPNTGGKTVALKTVGLLSAMVQSGLHVPADERSSFCFFDKILCDIGDGQSISDNLSTFSSHMTNILDILRTAGTDSLVLLDELGSGTDPAEGMGIAVSVLEELRTMNCLFVATTHYPEIKDYAARTRGLINARMAFDKESLMPCYRLEIGEAGESCALYIAERLGMPAHMLKRAYDMTYSGKTDKITAKPGNNESKIIPVVADVPEEISIHKEQKPAPRSLRFLVGDSVTVYPQREIGVVYACANEKGEVGVQIKGKKRLVNHKRLKLKVAASELYPENYDLSIVFDSVANRKARHVMDKKHVDGNTIILDEGTDKQRT